LSGCGNIRKILGLKLFPVTHSTEKLREIAISSGFKYLASTFVSVATAGAITKVKTSPAELTTIIYHHRGLPRIWIVIPPSEKINFENMIWNIFQEKFTGNPVICSQVVEHLNVLITPDLLQIWGIKFVQVRQAERQIVIMFPSAYYWGVSTGFSIIESRYWIGPAWDVQNYHFCYAASQLCCDANEPGTPFLYLSEEVLAGK
jgi:hypothetical protein